MNYEMFNAEFFGDFDRFVVGAIIDDQYFNFVDALNFLRNAVKNER